MIDWNLITSVATLITSVILLFTLFEMNKQRKAAYLPNLFLETKEFFILLKRKLKYYDDSMFSNSGENISKQFNYPRDCFGINLINAGVGSALYVKATWLFNINHFISNFLEVDKTEEFNITQQTREEAVNHKHIVSIESKFGNILCIVKNKAEALEFDICPSYSINKDKLEIHLCSAYESLLARYLHLLMDIESKRKKEEDLKLYGEHLGDDFSSITNQYIIPPLFLKLEYMDIEKNLHTKYFQLQFNRKFYPIGYQKKRNNTYLLEGNIKVKEVKNIEKVKQYLNKNFDLELSPALNED